MRRPGHRRRHTPPASHIEHIQRLYAELADAAEVVGILVTHASAEAKEAVMRHLEKDQGDDQ